MFPTNRDRERRYKGRKDKAMFPEWENCSLWSRIEKQGQLWGLKKEKKLLASSEKVRRHTTHLKTHDTLGDTEAESTNHPLIHKAWAHPGSPLLMPFLTDLTAKPDYKDFPAPCSPLQASIVSWLLPWSLNQPNFLILLIFPCPGKCPPPLSWPASSFSFSLSQMSIKYSSSFPLSPFFNYLFIYETRNSQKIP